MENQLPKIESYGEYSSKNYGVNALSVDLGTITIFYSYKTIVAYKDEKDGVVCCKNSWGTTTGIHLNWIQSDKKARVTREKFQEMLAQALKRHIQ